jgi:hypothetical protein
MPKEAAAAYRGLVARSDTTLWHLLRLTHPSRSNWAGIVWLYQHGHHAAELAARCRQVGDIRIPIAIAERLGAPRGHAVREMLREWGATYRGDEVPSLAFHVYEHLDLIEEALGLRPRSGDRELVVEQAVKLLGDLPKVPEQSSSRSSNSPLALARHCTSPHAHF